MNELEDRIVEITYSESTERKEVFSVFVFLN